MTAHLVHEDTFTAITVTDTRGAALIVERTDDGRLSAWIAPPGSNDGHSVQLGETDLIALVAYLSAGTLGALVPASDLAERDRQLTQSRAQAATYANETGALKAELERMRGEWDRLVNERAALLGVVEAAKEWRAIDDEEPGYTEVENALVDAVDALPKAATV